MRISDWSSDVCSSDLMHDGAVHALQRLEGARDQFGPRLGQHLDGDIGGDQLVLDDLAHEGEIGIRGGREADLDLLEAELHQGVEHAAFALGPPRPTGRASVWERGLPFVYISIVAGLL